jgi:hypothetical protein
MQKSAWGYWRDVFARARKGIKEFLEPRSVFLRAAPALLAQFVVLFQFGMNGWAKIWPIVVAITESYVVTYAVLYVAELVGAVPALLRERDQTISSLGGLSENAPPLRGDMKLQLRTIWWLIAQMRAPDDMWLSQIFMREGWFHDPPKVYGVVDYPAAVEELAKRGIIEILERKQRNYKDFCGENFLTDIRFRRANFNRP